MKANENKLEDFLSSNKTQFVIPVYQRNYDWNIAQCKQLIDDILDAGSKNINAHFIGSIVFIHDDVYTTSRVKELTIIDGQQRLTTLTLIYVVLYKLAQKIGRDDLVTEISETYLINKFAPEEEKLKLRPTDNNDKAFKFLLRSDENEDFNTFSKIIINYNYFCSRITEENFEVVMKGLSKLMFVEISLERGKDDPQRIFESLNSTGLELSEADLIRNYILMGLKPKEQNKIYHNYWEIIEKAAKDERSNISKVSDYIRDYLTLISKKIPNKKNVYTEFKAKYPTTSVEQLEQNLQELKDMVKHYNKLLNPKNESDKEIRLQLEYIHKLEVNVVYPFLIKIYDDFDKGIISKVIFLQVLHLIQSFVWRRFILGLPTNALNKIFMSLYENVNLDRYLESIQEALLKKTGVQRFPKNSEIVDTLKFKDVYNIQSKNRTYFLDKLENFNNNERVAIDTSADITIEHIFPQNPDPKWKNDLGIDEYNYIRENYLNTIGNLTLSGNNGKLGNKTFIEKRDLESAGYKDSRLWLNKYLSIAEKWDRAEIERRFDLISERFLKIWQYPDVVINSVIEEGEINIFDADEPKSKKLYYAIFMDQKIEVTQVAKLYVEVISRLFDLEPDRFFTTDLAEKLHISKDPNSQTYRQPAKINDSYYIESNIDSNGKFHKLKYALEVFELEDELFIKYSDEE